MFNGNLNSRLSRVPHHKPICVDLYLIGIIFALFTLALGWIEGGLGGGGDYSVPDLFISCIYFFLSFFLPDYSARCNFQVQGISNPVG